MSVGRRKGESHWQARHRGGGGGGGWGVVGGGGGCDALVRYNRRGNRLSQSGREKHKKGSFPDTWSGNSNYTQHFRFHRAGKEVRKGHCDRFSGIKSGREIMSRIGEPRTHRLKRRRTNFTDPEETHVDEGPRKGGGTNKEPAISLNESPGMGT